VRAVAVALCVALAATGARASDPVYDAPEKAPEVYGPLVWRDVHGFWFTDAQVNRIDLRIKYLEDKAAKECTEATNAETKRVLGLKSSVWIVAGAAFLVGIAGGVYAAKKF
jgi:hypothetical protein